MRILRGTIWKKGALDHEPKKYRSLWRVWLPLYDIIAIFAGIFAVTHGSRTLDRIFGTFLDPLGVLFAVVALICLIGVSFPKLWKLETIGKSLLVGIISAYVYCILFIPSQEQLSYAEAPSYFVACMLLIGLPLPLFRLNQLAEEQFDRRVQARARELRE